MNIVEFIEARIAEDELIANAAAEEPSSADQSPSWQVVEIPYEGISVWDSNYNLEGGQSTPITDHIARHDPARALQQCKALRDAVATVQDLLEEGWSEDDAAYMRIRALSSMAAIWSNHPDYQQEWESQ